MNIGRILIPLYENPLNHRLLDMAHELMASNEACLHVAYCRNEPMKEIAFAPEIAAMAGLTVDALEQASVKTARNIQTRLQDWSGQHGYDFVPEQKSKEQKSREQPSKAPRSVTFLERVGEPAKELTRLGRLSDLILCLRRPDEDSASASIFETSVITTGRPVLAVPPQEVKQPLRHILVAWDGSLVASRMIRQILPVLRGSDRVSIFTYPESDCDVDDLQDLPRYLACHGISAEPIHVRDGSPVGVALADAARILDVSLVAMGAYSHSRSRQYLLGGLTRYVLEKTKLPLLMAH